MSQEIDRQEMAIRYLLGTLSEEEKTRLEEQYFVDDIEFEQLEIAEDELIDRYVRTELSADDERRFEKLLISPRLSERVEVARMIAQRTAPLPQPQEPVIPTPRAEPRGVSWWQNLFGPAAVASPAFRPAMAFGLSFMLLTTVALFFVWMKLRTESQRLAQEQQQREELARKMDEQTARYGKLDEQLNQTRREKEEQQQLVEEYKQRLAQEQQRTQQGFTFPFFLNPGGGSRGIDGPSPSIQSFTVPRGAAAVSLTLNVTDEDRDYARYNAMVRNFDTGKEVSRPNLKPFERQGRKYITLKLDAKLLPPGSYNVRVDGVDPTGKGENFEDYPFRVRPASR